MTILTKKISFHAAHILTGYPGKCKNLHGHTYVVELDVRGVPDTHGIAVDFRKMKEVLKTRVLAPFDHAFIYDASCTREREIGEFLAARNLKTAPLPCPATSENLAKYVYALLQDDFNVVAVRVRESDTSCAEFRSELP